MNIIFLGLMFCDESLNEAYVLSKTGVQMAPHKYQSSLISGLRKNNQCNLYVINIPPVGSFPINYKKLFLKELRWGENDLQVGFINLPVLKRAIQVSAIVKKIDRLIKSSEDSQTHIVLYSVFKPFLKIASIVKKRYPGIKISMIMTDPIPGIGDFARNAKPSVAKKGSELVRLSGVCDKFILLTEQMNQIINPDNKPYTIIECVCDDLQPPAKVTERSRNICLYTGALDVEFGIKEMVDAFAKIEDAELWICGRGNAQEYIEKLANENSNIKFFGFVNQEKIKELRNECDYLINPRRPTGTFTKYSFPSKTAEYMASGKPVIMYKLEGVPDEYDKHLIYLSASTSNEISEELKEIFKVPYSHHLERAHGAYQFIKNEKSPISQATKVINLLAEN